MRIAVMGTYRSGTSTVAGILYHLGVDLGGPFGGDFYESLELTSMLRKWWNEPHMVAAVSSSTRRMILTQWAERREAGSEHVGAKHPILSMCGQDLLAAWGADTRFVWCQRPIEDAITSLENLRWFANARAIQNRLNDSNADFFQSQPCHVVKLADLAADCEQQVHALISGLGLNPSAARVSAAIDFARVQRTARKVSDRKYAARTREDLPIPNGVSAEDAFLNSEFEKTRPQIIATVLSGNSEHVIGEAISSVIEWVDKVCLIDTGITDSTAEVVQQLAGEKLVRRSFAWCNDFAAARNAALHFAEEIGGTWAFTCDSDERFLFSGISEKRELINLLESEPQIKAWLVSSRDGSYAKERFIRVPTDLAWSGTTHEALTGAAPGARKLLPNCRFFEARKTADQYRHKVERDLEILLRETQEQPHNARWWYYLGQTYEGLKQYRQAVEAFERCVRLDSWAEEGAWACYTAARCLAALGEYREAEEYCSLGLTRKPTAPELTWMASWCCFKRGALSEAIMWAKLTLAQREHAAFGSAGGFRYVPAWFEAPFDVLRYAYRRIGDNANADYYETEYTKAKAARDNIHPFGSVESVSPLDESSAVGA